MSTVGCKFQKRCSWQDSSWATHSYSTCVLRFIVLSGLEASAGLWSWAPWTRLSLTKSLDFSCSASSQPWTVSLYVPLQKKKKHLHSMMLPPLGSTAGMALCRWGAVPGFLQTWGLEVKPNRSDLLLTVKPTATAMDVLEAFSSPHRTSGWCLNYFHWRIMEATVLLETIFPLQSLPQIWASAQSCPVSKLLFTSWLGFYS